MPLVCKHSSDSESSDSTTLIPLYLAEGETFVGLFSETQVYQLIQSGRAKIRRHGRVRRAYLFLTAEDREDPTIMDLKSKMLQGRKTVRKEVFGPGRFTWAHSRRGALLDEWQKVAILELKGDRVI